MDISELEKKILWLNRKLLMKLEEYADLKEKAGKSERDYRTALATKMLSLRVDGTPVTIIPDLARGDKVVADAKLQRDIDDGIADACKESIRGVRASMSSIQSLISTRKEEMRLL
jgi:hypothetical protein